MLKGFRWRAFLRVSASECQVQWFHLSGCCKAEVLSKRGRVCVTNHLNCTTDVFVMYLSVVLKKFWHQECSQLFIMTDAAAFSVTTENKRIKRMACWSSLLKKPKPPPQAIFILCNISKRLSGNCMEGFWSLKL